MERVLSTGIEAVTSAMAQAPSRSRGSVTGAKEAATSQGRATTAKVAAGSDAATGIASGGFCPNTCLTRRLWPEG